jgi:hypothetical protein
MGIFAHFSLLMHEQVNKGALMFLFAQGFEQIFLVFGHGTANAMVAGAAFTAEFADADAGRGNIGHGIT